MAILPEWLFNPQAMAGQGGLLSGLSDPSYAPQQGPQQGMSFAQMWDPAANAIRRGQFDPEGMNYTGAYLSPFGQQEPGLVGRPRMAGPAMAYAPEPQPPAGLPPIMTQGAPPAGLPPQGSPAPQMQSPGFGDRAMAGLMGFFNAGSPMGAIGNLIGGVATGERQDTAGRSSDDIREFEYARKQGFQGTFADWMQRKRAGAGEYGLNAIWGKDAEGNPAIVQLGKGGEAIQSKLPAGFSPAKDPIKVDLGTHWAIIDPQTRQTVSILKKDLEGKEAAEARGKSIGGVQFDLPRIESNAKQALDTIEQIRSHPGKQYAVGVPGIVPGIPGTQQKDFIALVDQAKGKAFLEAFNSLKGGGQITEVEGKKATDAIARLERTQSRDGFDRALKDLEDVIKAGVVRARTQAGQGSAAPEKSGNSGTWQTLPGGAKIREVK